MRTILIAAALLALPGWCAAQSYPEKTIRIVCPTSPGGGTDLVSRMLAQKLNKALGQPVVVENRGGAGTTLGTALVAKAPPDGYTLLLTHTSLAFNATFYRHLPFDAVKDFAPVSLLASQPFVVVVHPSLPAKSLRDLLALAKSQAGEIQYASGGAGSGPFMATELLKQMAHVDLLHVPYKGAGPAFTDLMGGQVQVMIGTFSLALPHAKTGRVRALAVTSEKRAPAAPELPTVAEAGVPGYSFETWYGLLAPAGTPDAIVSKLNALTVKAVASPDSRARLIDAGLEPVSSSSAEFAAHLAGEVEKWRKVVTAAKISAN